MKILSDQPAPLATLDPTVDAGVATVVYKALAKNPADRYQDLGAMKADLVRDRAAPRDRGAATAAR